MLIACFQGLVDTFRPATFVAVFLGMLIGIIIGILPAIGAMTGMVLLLPLFYGMEPLVALPMLISLHSVSIQGGSITTILLNIPGDSPNTPTLIDGYPMTRKGESGRALGAALTSSGTGGVMGVVMALLLIPVVVPLVLAMKMPEMLFLVLVALSFVVTLGGKGGQIKGMIAGLLGMLVSLFGWHDATGVARFMFGSAYLFNGLAVAPVAIGLFAGAEMLELAVSGETIAKAKVAATPLQQIVEGMRDVYRHIGVWFRSCVVGYIIGVMPGVGATASGFLAYGQAKKTSKHPEKFGTGCVEGVIAPESANASCHGGDLLTTISFGIPGSGSMAILLAAYLVVGLPPGPGMLTDHPALAFTLLWTNAVSNVMAAIIGLFLAFYLIKVTTIRPEYLLVTVMTLMFISVFAMDQSLGGMVVIMVFTAVGFFMQRLGYSRPAFLLGFVLGNIFEDYLWLSFKLWGLLFFMRPISIGLIALIIFVLGYSPIKSAIGGLLRKRANPVRPS